VLPLRYTRDGRVINSVIPGMGELSTVLYPGGERCTLGYTRVVRDVPWDIPGMGLNPVVIPGMED